MIVKDLQGCCPPDGHGRRKSVGHLAYTLGADGIYREVYKDARAGGDIYIAPVSNAFDLEGYRHGRWEGPDRPLTRRVLDLPPAD